ncbi:MAG: hypothetical protein J6Q22_10560 [Prevotella sp.]|nr:hypothetical protein [Prevotella sp.]
MKEKKNKKIKKAETGKDCKTSRRKPVNLKVEDKNTIKPRHGKRNIAKTSMANSKLSKSICDAKSGKPIIKQKNKTSNQKANRSLEVEKELAALKEETASLQAENARLVEQYGQMLEVSTNIKFKANAMLGQILKALYIMGIGPDDILAKCQQMFMKKVVAD